MDVVRLGLTPVKNCRHEDLTEVHLAPAGPVGDRVFCFVDVARRRVLRSVENPSLLAVRARWDGTTLTLGLPDGGRVSGDPTDADAGVLEADYWGRTARLRLQDGPHALAVSELLGHPVAVARVEPGEVVYGASVSLVATGELADLADELGVAGTDEAEWLDRRFRATATVDAPRCPGPGSRVRLGDAVVEVRAAIPRCAVVDLEPRDGTRRSLPVLAALVRRRPDGVGEPAFGVDAVVVEPGTVTLAG